MLSMSFSGSYASKKTLATCKIDKVKYCNNSGHVRISNAKNLQHVLRQNSELLGESYQCKMTTCIHRTRAYKLINTNALQLQHNTPVGFALCANIFGTNLKIKFMHRYENVPQSVYTVVSPTTIHTHTENTSGVSILAIYQSGQISVQGKCIETNEYSLNLFLKALNLLQ